MIQRDNLRLFLQPRLLLALQEAGQYSFQMACLWATNHINSRRSESGGQALYKAINPVRPDEKDVLMREHGSPRTEVHPFVPA